MAGTLSYALCSYALGALLDRSIERFVPIVCAAYALGGLCSLLLPSVPTGERKKRPRFLSLLKKKELRTLLVFALCLQAAQGVFYTLYGLLMTQTLGGLAGGRGAGHARGHARGGSLPALRGQTAPPLRGAPSADRLRRRAWPALSS